MKKKRGKINILENLKKKGISPVIATVLLVGMVVVTGLIVFLWFRGIIQEEGEKFGKNVKLVCEDVTFDASYSGGVLSIVNTGNVPIYRIKVKKFQQGGYSTIELSEGWDEFGLNSGQSYSTSLDTSGLSKILLIPVLIAGSDEGRKTYTCEDSHGYEIFVNE